MIRSGTIRANGLEFEALTAGPVVGPLTLFLHGFPQTADSWRFQIDLLAGMGHRAVAINQRGYSAGAMPETVPAYRLSCLVDDVMAVADALDAPRLTIVGHDWGGLVAWAAAARHPDRIESMVSVSTPHPVALADALRKPDQRRRSMYVPLFRWRHAEKLLLAGKGLGLRTLFAVSGMPSSLAGPYLAAMQAPGRLTGALNWYRANDFGSLGILGSVTVPVTYVWGDRDPALGPEAAQSTGAHVKGAYDFQVLHGEGHWIPELASSDLNRLLLRHYDRLR